MKILHLISGGDEGGAKTQIITLLKELSKQVDITLVCLVERNFADEARKQGINVVVMEQSKRYDLNIINNIVDMLNVDYDILHCHGARANFLGVFIKRRINIPTVTTLHSDYKSDFDNNLYKKIVYTTLNYLSLKRMDYYIALSNKFKQELINRGFNKKNIYVAYNGVKIINNEYCCQREQFIDKYNIDFNDDTIIVGIATRLHPVKGIPVFINAAKKVLQRNDNIKFLIAGNGEQKFTNKYTQMVSNSGLEHNIIFLGYVKDMNSFYNAIDINVLTSHSEGMPYVLLEGGINKKATISSAVGGIPELIKDAGMLFEDNDYNKLAKDIEILIKDEHKRIELGEALYKRIEEKFSDKSMVKSHIEIYTHILKSTKKIAH